MNPSPKLIFGHPMIVIIARILKFSGDPLPIFYSQGSLDQLNIAGRILYALRTHMHYGLPHQSSAREAFLWPDSNNLLSGISIYRGSDISDKHGGDFLVKAHHVLKCMPHKFDLLLKAA